MTARIIKKYGNRRLYDTETSSYVNLEEVARLLREGHEVEVVDAKSGEDLTRHVLTQIIVEEARDPEGGPPVDFLRQFIRSSDRAQRDFLHWYLGTAGEAWKRVQEVWSNQPSWPSLKAQREAWATILDPLGAVRAMMKVARPDSEETGPETSGEAGAEGAAEELAELRKRLEQLERKLGEP